MSVNELVLSEEEWRERLSPETYAVLREAATEAPGAGKYVHVDEDGTFRCAGCGTALFSSASKFDSGSGWPSFDRAAAGTVEERPDYSLGVERTEITCTRCGGHLGHVFPDGPTETGRRFCVNSLALEFDRA